jgi:ribosomal protein S18 acetylase RimI-like enzyme
LDVQNVVITLLLLAFVVDVPADKAMQDVFGAEYVSLHVRVSNKGAIYLYTQTLGYE